MGRSPYTSPDVGPLMRNVKNTVCRRLDMHGLLEDDFGMELLVAGRIMDLSLPVDLVYECVWRPHLQAQAAGRPGTARSPTVRSYSGAAPVLSDLPPPPVPDKPMVVTYRWAAAAAQCACCSQVPLVTAVRRWFQFWRAVAPVLHVNIVIGNGS